MIAKDALVYAQQGKRKTLQRKDLGKHISSEWDSKYVCVCGSADGLK